jgi:hypothetical protein
MESLNGLLTTQSTGAQNIVMNTIKTKFPLAVHMVLSIWGTVRMTTYLMYDMLRSDRQWVS